MRKFFGVTLVAMMIGSAGCKPSVPYGRYEDVVKIVIETDSATKLTLWRLKPSSKQLRVDFLLSVDHYTVLCDVPDDLYPHVIWMQGQRGSGYNTAELHLRSIDIFGSPSVSVASGSKPTLSRSVLDGPILFEGGPVGN